VAEAAAGAELSVVFEDGDEAKARVVGRSPSYDLAVIKVDAGSRKLDPVVLGNSDALDVGDPVIAIGAPLGLIGTVTTGIISAKNRPVTTGESGENSYMSALQTDAAINPGNSGGPLVDMRGRVVGVNSAIASLGTSMGGQSGSIGLGFSIPVNQVKRVTNEIIRTGKATYPIIGAEIDPNYSGTGARIISVQAGSPAAQAGLRDGDVITAVDGTKVTTGVELIVKIRSNIPGGTIKLTTGAGGGQHVYSVKLGSKDG
jgi:putative serine protease PepD